MALSTKKLLGKRSLMGAISKKAIGSSNPYIVVPVVGFIALRKVSKFFRQRDEKRSKPVKLKLAAGESYLVTSKAMKDQRPRKKGSH
jgi:hypothetical protein